ncbi:MAG: LysM peptidoglycan-binding domain-containing protein [Caldilineaceae bacterium]|nr:LysM peptidoglycan-binding domain-containing protein [Caldilineaceae bacterium]
MSSVQKQAAASAVDSPDLSRQQERATRHLHVWFGSLVLLLLVGCGQVVTVKPTPTPAPTATIALAVVSETDQPTATPAPYTPAPTSTPTMTPTPVFHTIASGQSLLTIATMYNVSIAALQEANGILDPRTLQIGQQLIIPREEEALVAADSTPTPTPLPVAIENLHFTENSIGGVWVMGEVHNTTGTALEQVRVGATLVDAAGAALVESQTLVALDLVDLDERAPFAILFGSAPESFEQYQAYPISAVPAYVGSYYRDLAVEEIQTESERYASYTVTGVVRNTGPEEAVEVQVVLTAYDPMDRVIAVQKVAPSHNVVPRGGTTTFTAVLAPVGGPVERIHAEAQGRRVPSQ